MSNKPSGVEPCDKFNRLEAEMELRLMDSATIEKSLDAILSKLADNWVRQMNVLQMMTHPKLRSFETFHHAEKVLTLLESNAEILWRFYNRGMHVLYTRGDADEYTFRTVQRRSHGY